VAPPEGLDLPAPRPQRPGLVLATLLMLYGIESLLFRAIEASHRFGKRVHDSIQRVFAGLCAEALTVEEKSALTVRIYDAFPDYRSVGDTLYAWEEPWFASRLPPSPARVLVGACGTGREAVALAQRGYRVDAVEPAPEFVVESRRRLGARGQVFGASYEQLSALVLDAPDGARALQRSRYDAVILGSGSLTHVLEPREQQRILRAMSLLCPQGPILASFFCEDDDAGPPPTGRAMRLGRRIGRFIARARRLSGAPSDRLSYRAHSGFAYTFTPREIEQLARGIGREVAWEQGNMRPFHYATFLPPGSP
jgi:SAM-dependent methyltransferase